MGDRALRPRFTEEPTRAAGRRARGRTGGIGLSTMARVLLTAELTELGDLGRKISAGGAVAGTLFLGAAIVFGLLEGDGGKRFFHAYLVAFCWFLTVTLGALFFVTLQHLVRAGWS